MSRKTTPLMEQYLAIKQKYTDAVLFFRMGDFYEMFYEDAKIASDVLGLVLTSRAHGKSADVPLAGFPHHSLEPYLSKMLKAGHRVAICEQVEDPKKAKGIVKREVLEVVTPGTATSENVIDATSNNFLVSLFQEGGRLGLAGIDISTGEFFLTEGDIQTVLSHAEGLSPPEILLPEEQSSSIIELVRWSEQPLFSKVEDYFYSSDYAEETLLQHFKTMSLKGFGCEDYPLGISAAGAVIKYLDTIQEGRLGHIQSLHVLNPDSCMVLDKVTRRNLELVSAMRDGTNTGTLLSIIDNTVTKMGARLLKSWLLRPLLDKNQILKRLQAVEELYADGSLRDNLFGILKQVGDIERLTAKVNAGRANGRDVRALCISLGKIPELKNIISKCGADLLVEFCKNLDPLEELYDELQKAITDDPPLSINDGRVIREGYDAELDRIRDLAFSGKKWISDLQEDERQRTGITSLKIKYNKVFGYYIEVTNVHKDKVPDYYIRKQTLVNAERYITPEMKEREEEIMNAEERIAEREKELFKAVCEKIVGHTAAMQKNAEIIAALDVITGFAEVAVVNNYCKPVINSDDRIRLIESRHPVVENLLGPGDPFIPNDIEIDTQNSQVHLITGPNMAGKSTFLRQVGLCVLLAQTGCYVPAEKAEIGIVDRIFTRVGAMDDVSRGESTFLVEMLELANIMNNATPKSLLLLDEIGRGTSTFDGLSIAWATVEHLHNSRKVAAKTLFATHYHELTVIAGKLDRVANYNVQVKEWGDTVVFLRKIVPGSADHSYGIQVARMAGVPGSVIERAKEILVNLESLELSPKHYLNGNDKGSLVPDDLQVSLFSFEDTVVRARLKDINPEEMTPLEAIQLIFELKKLFLGDSK